MSRAVWFGILGAVQLSACDDGSLRAFEPRLALGGSGAHGPAAEAGGGRGGTGSAPEAGAGPERPTTPLFIDDFEDGGIRAKEPLGWWYPVNDETSTQGFGIEPVSRGIASVYALRTHGSGFQDWGSAVGVDLLREATPLDLRGYQELCFVGLVEAGSSTMIQVHLLRGPQHYNQAVSLSENWTRYCLPLADFRTSTQEPLVPTEVSALQFFFEPVAPFLFWLDDVEILPKE